MSQHVRLLDFISLERSFFPSLFVTQSVVSKLSLKLELSLVNIMSVFADNAKWFGEISPTINYSVV